MSSASWSVSPVLAETVFAFVFGGLRGAFGSWLLLRRWWLGGGWLRNAFWLVVDGGGGCFFENYCQWIKLILTASSSW